MTGGRVAGFSGCNRFSGSYTLDGRWLRFGTLAVTQMACADGAGVEAEYMKALEATRQFQIHRGTLDLLDAVGRNAARFSDPGAVAARGLNARVGSTRSFRQSAHAKCGAVDRNLNRGARTGAAGLTAARRPGRPIRGSTNGPAVASRARRAPARYRRRGVRGSRPESRGAARRGHTPARARGASRR